MGEHKLNSHAKPDVIDMAAQQRRAYQDHINTLSHVPSHFASVFAGTVLPSGHIRITYGDQLDPSVQPQFHGSFTSTIEAVRGLSGLLEQIVKGHDENMKRMAEMQAAQAADGIPIPGEAPLAADTPLDP